MNAIIAVAVTASQLAGLQAKRKPHLPVNSVPNRPR